MKGLLRSITTRSKADEYGNVHHLTYLRVVMEDVDRDTLDALALAEHESRLVAVALQDSFLHKAE